MATTRITTRQLKGHFDALRATKSHTVSGAIDIAAGNYGSGGSFSGVSGVSDPSWSGATNTFYVYLDTSDILVLDGASFPVLCTKIAQVTLTAGEVTDIVDERASINGVEDGYHIYFDSSNTTIVQDNNIQDAIETIDGYLAEIADNLVTSIDRHQDLPLLSGVLNGGAKVVQASFSPAISLEKRDGVQSRVMYTISLPDDYVEDTNLSIKVFWSTSVADAGDAGFKLEYRALTSGADNIDSVANTVEYYQAAPGVSNRLVDTGNNLIISAAEVAAGTHLLIINLVREGTVFDTFNSEVRIHLVRLEYIGRGVQ